LRVEELHKDSEADSERRMVTPGTAKLLGDWKHYLCFSSPDQVIPLGRT